MVVMIESHLALYLPRGSATAWLNRPEGLTQSNTELDALTRKERKGTEREEEGKET